MRIIKDIHKFVEQASLRDIEEHIRMLQNKIQNLSDNDNTDNNPNKQRSEKINNYSQYDR